MPTHFGGHLDILPIIREPAPEAAAGTRHVVVLSPLICQLGNVHDLKLFSMLCAFKKAQTVAILQHIPHETFDLRDSRLVCVHFAFLNHA